MMGHSKSEPDLLSEFPFIIKQSMRGRIRLDAAARIVSALSDQEVVCAVPPPADAFKFEDYRELLRGHLKGHRALFRRLTGLGWSVAWAPPWPERWGEQALSIRSRVCRELTSRNPAALARCRDCGMKHLALTLKRGEAGHHFLCHRGVRNSWFPLTVGGGVIGIACVSAWDANGNRRRAGQAPAHASGRGGLPPEPAPGQDRKASGGMTSSEFRRVGRILRLIVQDAQSSTLADSRERELARAQQALLGLQSMAARLREGVQWVRPTPHPTAPVLQPEPHATQMVRSLLDCICRNYAQPITLQQCAARLRLNVSYLSHIFSRVVGVPFKTYLTKLRIEKAKELLSDPARSISAVAYSVGYASENRFRIAFRKATGLPPRLWRETLQTESPHPSQTT
jgi:AraC-like DNA-binding protein/ribosomal protein L40E